MACHQHLSKIRPCFTNVFGRKSIGALVKFRRQTQSPLSILYQSTHGSTRCPIANSQLPTGEVASPFGANPESLYRLAQSPARRRPVETRPAPADRGRNISIATEIQLPVKQPIRGLLEAQFAILV